MASHTVVATSPPAVHVFGASSDETPLLLSNPCIDVETGGCILCIHDASTPCNASAHHSVRIRDAVPHDAEQQLLLMPGLIDLQFNGGFDVDFSQAVGDSSSVTALSQASVQRVCSSLCATGVTSFMATLVSSSRSTYESALRLFQSFLAHEGSDGIAAARIVGLHMEGPFLAQSRKGAHACSHLISPARAAACAAGVDTDLPDDVPTSSSDVTLTDAACAAALQHVYGPDFNSMLDAGQVRIVTIAPELNGAASLTRFLSSRGVFVCLGHSDATRPAIQRCVAAGATGVTHMFNAMRALGAREAGLIGALTHSFGADAPLSYGLICDGAHVCDATMRLATGCNVEGLFLVTDAMCALGCAPGPRLYGDMRVTVKEGNDEYPCRHAVVEGTSVLAGAVAPLCACVRNLVRMTGVQPHVAVAAATRKPAQLCRLSDVGGLTPGMRADFVIMDAAFNPLATYVGGVCAYRA